MNVTAFATSTCDGLPRVPPDIVPAIVNFGANCGPVSLAAVFEVFVIEVMKFFPDFPGRDYVNLADMRHALLASGARFDPVPSGLPVNGIVLVQLHGPWTRPGTPVAAQLRYTHWVGCRNGFVFDLNIGDWLEREEWERSGAMSWMRTVEGCTGFSERSALAITPRKFEFSPFGRVPSRSAH